MALQLCAMRPSGKLLSVAGLTDVAIYPDHRRRGIAGQMLRAAIAQAGYERTMRDHTYPRRFSEIFEQLGMSGRHFLNRADQGMHRGCTIEVQ